jgi:fructose-specific component phosphotransferase system IIB-like protein
LRKMFLNRPDRSGLVSVMGDSRPPETSMNGRKGLKKGRMVGSPGFFVAVGARR